MKSYLSFAWKELKAQKVMASLILIALILSSTMTTAVSGSLGILQAMRLEQAASLNGNRYATFHQLTQEQMLKLQEDPRLFDVGSLINVGTIELGNSGLTLYAREFLGDALKAYPSINKIKEGRLPDAPGEIALPENALPYLDGKVSVGDTISPQAEIGLMDGSIPAYEYSADFLVCGILEANYVGYSTGTLDAVLGEGTADAILPEEYRLYSTDFKTKDTGNFQEILNQLAASLEVDSSHIQYNWILLDALGISYEEKDASDTDTGFSFMSLTLCLIGALVLLAAGLVIYNILKISVTKRIGEFGILRAIGGQRSQLYRLVSLELLVLCGMGIPLGLLAGALSSKAILTAATGVLNPDLFLANSTEELSETIRATTSKSLLPYAVSIGVTLLFAMLAAFPAARYAAHVSPTLAMAGQRITVRRRSRKPKTIRSFEAYYARLNLKRGRGRTAVTILSLLMSITVFVALQSFSSILDTSQQVQSMHIGDFSVTNETLGIDPASVAILEEQEWVEHLAKTKLSVYTQDEAGNISVDVSLPLQSWEAFHIAGIDDTRLLSLAEGLSEQDKQELLSGDACIAKNPIAISFEGQAVEATHLEYGQILSVNGRKLRVVGLADNPVTINNQGFINGIQVIVNEDAYDALTGTDRYSEVYPTLCSQGDPQAFEEWLDSWCQENPGSHWLSYRQTETQLAQSFAQIQMLCWCLILFIGLIGILNIINTVYSNIHTRIPEIGMQRAMGMSAASLYQTFLWEGAYYGIIASLIGGALGYLGTIFVNAAVTDQLQLVPVPWLSILAAAVISIASCLLATAIPLRSIARMGIAPSIEAGE